MTKHIPPVSVLEMMVLESPLLYWDGILYFFEDKVKMIEGICSKTNSIFFIVIPAEAGIQSL